MKIGFDFDKIFIDYPPFLPAKLFDKFYKKKDNGILQYRIPARPEQIFRKVLHLPFMRPPIKENLDLLKKFHKKTNQLYLISSRFKFLEPETNRLIKKYKLDKIFNKLYFNYDNKQPHLFKNDILKKLQLDAYIDDDLSLLKHVAKENKKTQFYWLNAREKKFTLPKNIKQIYTLNQIFKDNNN